MSVLKDLRSGKTQKEMAEFLGISKSYYEKLERGAVPPTRKVIKKIKELFPDLDTNIFFAN